LADVTSGVPQGSVLGPLLFLMFVNDLPDYLIKTHSLTSSPVKLFADNIKAYQQVNTLSDAIFFQILINSIVSWCKYWQLSINVSKCQIIHLGKSNSLYTYHLSGEVLPNPALISDLGVKIDRTLSFFPHVAAISSKSRARCAVFLKAFTSRVKDIMLTFYKTYVRPLLEYGCAVWGPISSHNINTIEKVQRYFTNKIRGYTFLPYNLR